MMTEAEFQTLLAPNVGTYPANVAIPPGWLDLVASCHKRLIRIYPDYQVAEVKEKFGGLRFYTGPIPTELSSRFQSVIKQFEDKSFQTCQSCGKPGHLVTIGKWYYTLCADDESRTRDWYRERWSTVEAQ